MKTARPRITFDLDIDKDGKPGELCIYLNPEGRDALVQLLNELTPEFEHSHLLAKSFGLSELELDESAYREDAEVVGAVKILLRLDAWDEEYCPHVMQARSSE